MCVILLLENGDSPRVTYIYTLESRVYMYVHGGICAECDMFAQLLGKVEKRTPFLLGLPDLK